MKTVLACGLAALIVLAAPTPALAQTQSQPVLPAPTTKILAIGTLNPGIDPMAARAVLPAEVRETVGLYLAGKIDQWYSLQDRIGVAFILNETELDAAREMLEQLPLGQAHLMRFELIRLGPLNPLRQLQGMRPAAP